MRIGVGLAPVFAVAFLKVVLLPEARADEPVRADTGAAGQALQHFVERAREADIVVLGEIHDNPEHHRVQSEVVAALSPTALVFEMIPQDRETELNDLRATGADRQALADALNWAESGWPDFGYYAAIMEAAPQARVFGAGQPPADVSRAALEGAATVFGPDATMYGLDAPLDPEEQAFREAEMAAAHCDGLPPEALPGLVEAQRFRDAGIADATLWARIMTGGGQVVVITGTGHADKARGMPAMIALAEPDAVVAALGQFEDGATPPAGFDAVLLAPAPARADPCAAFRRKD